MHLLDHLVLKFDWANCAHSGDVGDDVVLCGFDRRSSRVGVVVVGFHVLSFGLLYLEEVLDGTGAVIVKHMELGFAADTSRSV